MEKTIQYSRKEFIHRIGTFFMLISIGLLIFFGLSEAAGQTNFNYFCGGVFLMVVAVILRKQYKRPSEAPSGRGSGFRRWIKSPFAPLRGIRIGRKKKEAPPPEDDDLGDDFEEAE